MPTDTPETSTDMRHSLRAAALAVAALLALPATAQTNDTAPFYAGASLGVTQVSNIYRLSSGSNSDRVTSAGLLAGVDTRLGRQHLTFDGSLQDNRYADNRALNNRSYSLRGALEWQTVGNLSGTLSALSTRSLAQFNLGGTQPYFEKNIERNEDYGAVVRLGMGTRYSLEAGASRRTHDFSNAVYDMFAYRQNGGSFGIYAMPGGNVRLGLVARRTDGTYPRYPVYLFGFRVGSQVIDYKRDDLDFTTVWNAGGGSTFNTRISSSRTSYDPASAALRNFHGTTGAVGWNWQATSKVLLNLQYTRDSGQDTLVQTADVNRVYTTWQLNGRYALSGKVSLNAGATRSRGRSAVDDPTNLNEGLDSSSAYNVGLQWAFSRGMSLGCQYNRTSRDSDVALNTFSASSYGCTGQLLVY
jgi:hypothetical protein